MQGAMNAMMGSPMMWGMGLFWLLGGAVLVLALMALIKYLLFEAAGRK